MKQQQRYTPEFRTEAVKLVTRTWRGDAGVAWLMTRGLFTLHHSLLLLHLLLLDLSQERE